MFKVRLIGAVLGTIGLLLVAFTGNGQEKLGLAGEGDSLRVALVRTPEIQKELKLSPKQLEKLNSVAAQAKTSKKKVEEAHGKGKGREKEKAKADDPAAKEQQSRVREMMRGVLTNLEREIDQEVNSILDSRQRTRLTQIVLRIEGPSAFLKDELIDALALGPEQLELIREIVSGVKAEQDQYKDAQKQAFDLVKASGAVDLEKVHKDQQKTRTRVFAYSVNKQAMPRIARVLTRRQREIYTRMLGDSFDLSKLSGPDGRPLLDDSAGVAGSLLREPAVQLELKLSNQQKEGVTRGASAEKILEPHQRARLRQIVFQAEGLSALSRPEVIKALQLDEEQLEQIQTALFGLLDQSKQLREALKREVPELEPGDAEQEEARKEQEKARLRSSSADLNGRVANQVRSILSRRQRELFDRMSGEPFDFSTLRVRPPAR